MRSYAKMWAMSERPAPPPEGALIAQALENLRPKLSVRAAAPRAGIGEARWRQIVKGYTTVSGTNVPVHGPAETVARMAQVVGVTPEQLAEAGREDAAEELRRLPALPDQSEKAEPTIAELAAQVAELQAAVNKLLGIEGNEESGSA